MRYSGTSNTSLRDLNRMCDAARKRAEAAAERERKAEPPANDAAPVREVRRVKSARGQPDTGEVWKAFDW